ncbi:MAG: hypothetical protein OEW15_03995 [Nitrospirota bacterium]|nr:hypothetical protein [Nitrospirota bacterium]
MNEIAFGVMGLFIGFLLIYFNKQFARLLVEQQNKFWGFHFDHREIMISRIGAFIAGAGFVIAGLLMVFKIIHFK